MAHKWCLSIRVRDCRTALLPLTKISPIKEMTKKSIRLSARNSLYSTLERVGLVYVTGLASQISTAYSEIVLSEENLPMLATLRIVLRVHSSGRR